jgi:hypothetical protein
MSTITHLCVRSTIGETTRDHDIKEVVADHMMTRQVQMRSPLEEAYCCSSVVCVYTPASFHITNIWVAWWLSFLLRLAIFPIPLQTTIHVYIHVPVMWCWINSPLASPMFHMAKCTVGAHTKCFFSASSASVLFRYEWFFSASSAPVLSGTSDVVLNEYSPHLSHG